MLTCRYPGRVHTSVDLTVAEWLADHRSDHVTSVARVLEEAGRSPTFYFWCTVAFLVAVTVFRRWRAGWPIVVTGLLADAAVQVLKPIIDRPRPDPELMLTVIYGPAMPSTHATFTASLVVAALLAPWWTSRRVKLAFAVVGAFGCALAGAAMIYLGGHWLTDVLVGWVLGAAIAWVVRAAADRVIAPVATR